MSNLLRHACLLSLVAGCSSAGLDAEAGRETGACIEGECFGGLECLSDLCVAPAGDSDGDSSPVTSAGSATGPSSSGSDSGSAEGPNPSGDPETSGSGPGSGPESGPSSASASMTAGDETTSGSDGDASAEEGETGPPQECDPPEHAACDAMAGNTFRAIGLNCAGEPQFDVATSGNAGAIAVRSGFGATDTWDPTEGSRFAVIGTGFTTDLDMAPPMDDTGVMHCSDDLGAEWDVGVSLPAPLDESVPSIAANWSASGAYDYTELRIEGDAPGGATSIAFDFAFFSAEYPLYAESEFADMFVAWLESESWTGSIAFDDAGEVLTQNSEFLTLRDDDETSPELAGTCMQGHTASPWLRTSAPLAQGEPVTLVFAVFDMADSIIDSYAFIDNVTFGCETPAAPSTVVLE